MNILFFLLHCILLTVNLLFLRYLSEYIALCYLSNFFLTMEDSYQQFHLFIIF